MTNKTKQILCGLLLLLSLYDDPDDSSPDDSQFAQSQASQVVDTDVERISGDPPQKRLQDQRHNGNAQRRH